MQYKITSFALLKEMLQATPEGDQCLEWPRGRYPAGYGNVWLKTKSRTAHTLAYEIFYGSIPEGLWVLHRCDNPPCFRPSHLFLGTHLDNVRDKEQKGRHNAPSGQLHWGSKLTEDQVRSIRNLHANGASIRVLIDTFGLKQRQISRIVRGERWKHIL